MKKGESISDRGTGDKSSSASDLSSSSRYISARWNARLVGTRISSGLDGFREDIHV